MSRGDILKKMSLALLCLIPLGGCLADQPLDITVEDETVRARILKTYERAQDGEAEAQNSIGRAYALGDSVRKDKKKAREWFARAAEQGDSLAQYNLYLLLTGGDNTSMKDSEQALKWLHAAADRYSVRAQFRLAELYRKGDANEPQDPARAAALYESAAKQGYAPAQYNIGRLYEDGQGVTKDETKAFFWFLAAARRGVVDAQIEVGTKYESGAGVAEDDEKAARWLKRAAVRNSPAAQYSLSALYALGKGVDKNLVKAYAWSELAAKQGLPAAITNREAFTNLLGPERLRQAKALTKRWAAQLPPVEAHGHRENSYFDNGSSAPISGLEALKPRSRLRDRN